MGERPRVGLLLLAGDSWWEAGVCDAPSGPYTGFLDHLENAAASIAAALATHFDVVSSGLLHTAEQTVEEARRFDAEHVDAVIVCPVVWTNDPPLVAFLKEARRVPTLLWAYDPYDGLLEYFRVPEWLRASGPVSVQQCSPILRRLGWHYEVVFGNENDERTMREVEAFASAAAVKSNLVGTRIAVVPSPCRVIVGSWVDEMHLLERFGVELLYVPVEQLAGLMESAPESKAADYVEWLKENCTVVDVSDDVLLRSARQSLALVQLVEKHGLAGIALDDFAEDVVRLLGFRPHLYHPSLGELGCTVGLEADVPGVLATIVLSRLAGTMGTFNELFTIDREQNVLLMGHPGMGELGVGDPETFTVTPDLEFDESQKRGAWVSYRAKPGPMTFLNMTPGPEGLEMTAFSGQSLPGPRVMEGYAHMIVAPEGDALALFKGAVKRGLLQHWGTVHGDILPELRYLAGMLGFDLHIL